MEPIIEINSITKEYVLGARNRHLVLRGILADAVRHPESLFVQRSKFKALDSVRFSVLSGEIIGLIGRNGAGKTTLLKLLSGITVPTSGSAVVRGTVSSLLEVGTGFRPELTGRENIMFSGVLLGMTKRDILSRFDEIVAFAGVERFIDMPVKHYSSGMFVRLGFAVASSLSADILFIDEVLAVGDTEFQERCIKRINDITGQGRTVLFVSHDLEVVRSIASRVVYFEEGHIKKIGEPGAIIAEYVRDSHVGQPAQNHSHQDSVVINSIRIEQNGKPTDGAVLPDTPFEIEFEYIVREDLRSATPGLIVSQAGKWLHVSTGCDESGRLVHIPMGKYRTRVSFPASCFSPGYYRIEPNVQWPNVQMYGSTDDISFVVLPGKTGRDILFKGKVWAPMRVSPKYSTESL